MPIIKVKPWGKNQGDFVQIEESDFDPDKHELLEAPKLTEPTEPTPAKPAEEKPAKAPTKKPATKPRSSSAKNN